MRALKLSRNTRIDADLWPSKKQFQASDSKAFSGNPGTAPLANRITATQGHAAPDIADKIASVC